MYLALQSNAHRTDMYIKGIWNIAKTTTHEYVIVSAKCLFFIQYGSQIQFSMQFHRVMFCTVTHQGHCKQEKVTEVQTFEWPHTLQAPWAFMRSLLLTLMWYCLQFSVRLQSLCCTCYEHVCWLYWLTECCINYISIAIFIHSFITRILL